MYWLMKVELKEMQDYESIISGTIGRHQWLNEMEGGGGRRVMRGG
jgi:hypothetical protein